MRAQSVLHFADLALVDIKAVVQKHLVVQLYPENARLRHAGYLTDSGLVYRLFQVGPAEPVAEAARAPVARGELDTV